MHRNLTTVERKIIKNSIFSSIESIPSKIYLFSLSYCPKDVTPQNYNPTTDIVEYSNMVPCINPSGEVGMYDTVRQRFFGNANSEGSFTYG